MILTLVNTAIVNNAKSMCENAKWYLWVAMTAIGMQEKVIDTCLWMEFNLQMFMKYFRENCM